MDEEAFTYASLRRLERQENTSPRLGRMEARFWERLGEHLAHLRQAFQDQQEDDPTSRRTVVLADELRNTQRLAESIWALREKKIVHAALAATRRREGATTPPEHASPEERRLFEASCALMQNARDDVSITDPFSARNRTRTETSRVDMSSPSSMVHAGATAGAAQALSTAPHPTAAAVAVTVPAAHILERRETDAPHAAPTPAAIPRPGTGSVGPRSPAPEEAQDDEGRAGVGTPRGNQVALRVVQALADVPQFAGPDLVTYELAAGEIGNLPARAAELLEKRGVVRVLPAQ